MHWWVNKKGLFIYSTIDNVDILGISSKDKGKDHILFLFNRKSRFEVLYLNKLILNWNYFTKIYIYFRKIIFLQNERAHYLFI